MTLAIMDSTRITEAAASAVVARYLDAVAEDNCFGCI
jgi:hypothetical protein